MARVVAAVSLFGHMFDSFYFEVGGCEGRKSGAAVSPASDYDVRDYSRLCSYSSLFGLHWLAWLSSSGPWFILGSFYPGRLELDDPGEGWLAQRAREGDGGKGRLRAFGFHGEDLD